MRYNESEGFAEKEKAEVLLTALREQYADKLISGAVEPTMASRPDAVFYQVNVLYHDKEKTPYPVRVELRSVYDYSHLVVDGCVHTYHLGTLDDRKTGEQWSMVVCHSCKGEAKLDVDKVIEHILDENGGKIGYERWEKENK